MYVHQPNRRQPKLCVWTDLNVYNMDQVLKCGNNSETRTLLQKIFSLTDTLKNQVLLDLYMQTIIFVKLQKFSKEQASALFSIVKQTHEVCASSPFVNVEECFSFFRELVLTHSVHRPPWSLKIFASDQVETITNHVVNTYFRNFKLYKYTFTPKVKLDISLQYKGLESPPILTPVEEATQEIATVDIEDATGALTPVEEPKIVENDTVQESLTTDTEASLELENAIRKAVSAELKQMHEAVERQFEGTDKAVKERVLALEIGKSPSQNKSAKSSPKSSAKGKRK